MLQTFFFFFLFYPFKNTFYTIFRNSERKGYYKLKKKKATEEIKYETVLIYHLSHLNDSNLVHFNFRNLNLYKNIVNINMVNQRGHQVKVFRNASCKISKTLAKLGAENQFILKFRAMFQIGIGRRTVNLIGLCSLR